MFSKLLKYEFKSCGKVLFPAFGLGVLGSLILHFFAYMLELVFPQSPRITDPIFSMIVGLYAVFMAVLGIGYVVARFFRTMVGREAYLTLTLPVDNSMHLWAKLISGYVFSVLGILTAIATMYAFEFERGPHIPVDGNILSILWAVVVFVAAMLIYMLAEFYFCCAVGSRFKNRIAGSVGTYFIAHNAVGVIGILTVIVAGITMGKGESQWARDLLDIANRMDTLSEFEILAELKEFMWTVILLVIVFFMIFAVIETLVTRYIVTKKVNLE